MTEELVDFTSFGNKQDFSYDEFSDADSISLGGMGKQRTETKKCETGIRRSIEELIKVTSFGREKEDDCDDIFCDDNFSDADSISFSGEKSICRLTQKRAQTTASFRLDRKDGDEDFSDEISDEFSDADSISFGQMGQQRHTAEDGSVSEMCDSIGCTVTTEQSCGENCDSVGSTVTTELTSFVIEISKVGLEHNSTITEESRFVSKQQLRQERRESSVGLIELLDGSKKLVSILAVTTYLMKVMPRADLPGRAMVYKNSFFGYEGVKALKKFFKLPSDEATVSMGLSLQRKKIVHNICGDHDFGNNNGIFRLQPFNEPKILNSFRVWNENVNTDALELISRLERLLMGILSSATDSEDVVDYVAARVDPDYMIFEDAVCELQVIDIGTMNESTRLAFGIRLYNLMISHAYIKVGVAHNSSQRAAFYETIRYSFGGGVILSLDDLEHGVIRANSQPPFRSDRLFTQNDPRRSLALDKLDPRIHFAICCGKHRLPQVKSLTPEFIDEDLQVLAEAYCRNDEHVSIDSRENQLCLSMLFYWYRSDFAKAELTLPEAILPYLHGEKKRKLKKMILRGWIRVKFLPYDWGTEKSRALTFDKNALDTHQMKVILPLTEPKMKKVLSSFSLTKEKWMRCSAQKR